MPETLDRASRTGWRLTFLKTKETTYLPGLSSAVRPMLSRDRWVPGLGRRRQPELHPRFGPEHVPQHFPEEWLHRHLGAPIMAVPIANLQRAATTRLVQMLSGGSTMEAAHYLWFPKMARHRKIPASLPATADRSPHRQAEDRFDDFVQAIAKEMSSRKLINYLGRRIILLNWVLDNEAWE